MPIPTGDPVIDVAVGLGIKKLFGGKKNRNTPKVRKQIRRDRQDAAAAKRGGRHHHTEKKVQKRRRAGDAKDVKHFAKNPKAAARVQKMTDRSNARLGRDDQGPLDLQKTAAAKTPRRRGGRGGGGFGYRKEARQAKIKATKKADAKAARTAKAEARRSGIKSRLKGLFSRKGR